MARKRQIKEPTSPDQLAAKSLLDMMLEYHKALAREARIDSAVLRAQEKRELQLKATKLDLEMARINQMKEEAAERFDRAMSAAHAAMVTGILHGDATGGRDWTITVPHEKGVAKKSDLIQLQIRHQEDEIEKAAKRVAKSRDAAEASRDRRQKGLDNIQKLLDIIRGMNPQF